MLLVNTECVGELFKDVDVEEILVEDAACF